MEGTSGLAATEGDPHPTPPRPGLVQLARWLRSPSGVTFWVILVFMVVGGYDRLAALGSGSLWSDEAQSTLLAFNILQTGSPHIVATHLVNNWEPLYPYLEALSILVLGYSNLAYRLPSALLGIALIPVAFSLGARLRDRYVGIALAGMTAFSSEYIAWSRQARWYILLVLLMALGFLAALAWTRARDRYHRVLYLVAMVGIGILALLASLGLFLMYVPGILVGGLIYLLASHWEFVRKFFGHPSPPLRVGDLPGARLVPYRFRLWILVGGVTAVTCVLLFDHRLAGSLYVGLLTPLIGYTPFPLFWSGLYGPYLLQYYPWIVGLALLSVVFIGLRRNPFELALLGFCATSFVSVSLLNSITAALAAGTTLAPERHILPLLFFLFLLAAIAIVELLQRAFRLLAPMWPDRPRVRVIKPALFGATIVLILVLPGVVVPSNLTVAPAEVSPTMVAEVQWYPFSLDPAYPSALYDITQNNFQLAADYVLAHRNASEVTATTSPSQVAVVFRAPPQYWVDGTPHPWQTWYQNGRPTFFQTGSLLVSNTSQFEGLLLNDSGWFITTYRVGFNGVFPMDMNLVISDFMTLVPAGSDISIHLYQWTQSTPLGLLRMLEARSPNLQVFGNNTTNLVNWAVTWGVTTTDTRDLLLPLVPAFLPYVSPTVLPLAVLFNVYNHRPDLQQEFPQVLETPQNKTALIEWAYLVASGKLADPAQPTLAPYVAWYQAHA